MSGKAANCRHCNLKKANQSRQLCWACWHRPGVKESYPDPKQRKSSRRGVEAGQSKPCRPTDTLPGTEERFRVLEERVLRGESTKHPNDASLDSLDT